MKNDDLFRKAGALGYPLFEKEAEVDANVTLAEVARSRELRLWEGFPLMLANAAQRGLFDQRKVMASLKKRADRECLLRLLFMSFGLYKLLALDFTWAKACAEALNYKKAEYDRMFAQLKKGRDFLVCGRTLSPQRLKNTFRNYFNEEERKLSELVSMKEEFGLEYALSQVFPPKQKELFFKKLKGEKLTKTEREYYSRSVRKRVMALANPELHRLAQKIT